MTPNVPAHPGKLKVRAGHEVLLAQAVGPDAIRVRLGRHKILPGGHGAFREAASPNGTDPAGQGAPPEAARANGTDPGGHGAPPGAAPAGGTDPAGAGDGIGQWDGERAFLTQGNLRLEVRREGAGWDPGLGVAFRRVDDGRELLTERRMHFSWPAGHLLEGSGTGLYRCVQEFAAAPGERFHGLGGRPTGRLELNGQGFDLVQRNGEVSIPVVFSSLGYGFVWNHPGTGRAEFGDRAVRWTADQALQLDYVVFAGETPAALLGAYADLTGHAPVLPAWALGLWQSSLRYLHQDEILAVARRYADLGLRLSVVVSDGGHWTAMGDFGFDPAEYPDAKRLTAELAALGCRLMVSVWPTVSPLADSYEEWRDAGLLVAADQGGEFPTMMGDKLTGKPIPLALIDSTNPEARAELWRRVKEGYVDKGVNMFWLDADEPEHSPGNNRNLSFYAGPGEQVVTRYPLDHARAFTEGAAADGGEVLLLSRSAWIGQQALGCAVWSGDIPATWDSLDRQVKVGQQMAMSGIPWWTSDIGGFFGGDPGDEDYRELFIRWLQYGAHCPLFRIHGIRDPRRAADVGGPAEIWAFGEAAYPILASAVRRREALRPYLERLAAAANATGLPPMRPLFVDFPEDPAAWDAADQFMLGEDLLVAPVTAPGLRERKVYLPAGARWRPAEWSAAGTRVHLGGERVTVPAPLEAIPVFERIR
ncbi:MAG: family 31 glucosidase [Bifidobacteriaceae bacterium]|jgi:alpha-D-xyloside xylohydrolase|nr:family 31 glucosidase [Bifidobacteriaceae bacterium]